MDTFPEEVPGIPEHLGIQRKYETPSVNVPYRGMQRLQNVFPETY